jgi:hypothetical protein
MRLARASFPLVVAVLGCSIEAPPPSPFADAGASRAGGPTVDGALAGGRFTARTDGGEARPLKLRQLSARVTTNPGTLRSHLTMEVAGPANERVEALVRIPVPRGAAVTGAVLWIDGRARNGAFVERERAQEIYRSIVSRRRDPALVTWDGPEWVAVSIFPLERGEPRRFELEWVEATAPTGGEVKLQVPALSDDGRLVGRATLEVDGRPVRTDGRDVVTVPLAPAGAQEAVTARAPGDPFQRILVRGGAPDGPAKLVLLVETSAAMTPPQRASQRAALSAILGALPTGARVTLLAADWRTTALAEAVAPAEAERALPRLDAIPSAGALHLERALTEAAARAAKDQASVLFVGRGQDGFHGDAVRRPLAALRQADTRMAVVATDLVPAPLADAAGLTGGEAVEAAGLGRALPALLAYLGPRPARPEVARGVESWHALDTAGGRVAWIGRALGTALAAGGPAAAGADAEDLLALWERARLDRGRPAHAVLTPLRSLLVLETDADYARFSLEAPAPVAERSAALEKAARRAPDTAIGADAEDVLGGLIGNQLGQAQRVGSLALVGSGSGGGETGQGMIRLGSLGTIGLGGNGPSVNGAGHGRGGVGTRHAPNPDVAPGQLQVRGGLDKEIIRRIIRRHINEVKYCYEQELVHRPELQGRIAVQLTIGNGRVLASVLQHSTIGVARVESCVVQAVRRWEFPRPLDGGLVVVGAPFVLASGRGAPLVDAVPMRADGPGPGGSQALAALGSREPLAERVARVTQCLGIDETSDPETAAWLVDRSWASLDEVFVVARLLVLARRTPDAIRVLSERADSDPRPVAAELQRMGADADAAEVTSLSKR